MKKVYYNLKESVYYVTVENVNFIFSSAFHAKIFNRKLPLFKAKLTRAIHSWYRINFESTIMAALWTYSKVEKRGFLIKCEGVEYKCLEEVKLSGGKLIKNYFPIQSELLTLNAQDY